MMSMERLGNKASGVYGLVIAVAICLLLITPALAAVPHKVSQEIPYGPYVDEIVFSEVSEETDALEKLNAGDLHLWLWGIETPEGLATADELPNVDYVNTYPGMYDLFVNPLPYVNISGEPRFNPFGIREVREAINWLVDREYIAKEVLGGLGYPDYTVYTPYAIADYARTYPKMMELESEYSHDFDKAREVIFNALTDAGCTFKDGKWYDPDGNLIELYFVIRTEDMRKDIGDYVASLLEDIGFTVHRDYGTLWKAIPKVYGGISDWHLYTEGWAFEAMTAYDDSIAYYMYCSPWTGAVFEYYTPSPRLVELTEKLLNAEYSNMTERLSWIEEINELCLKDSTRVWLVVQVSPFPYNTGVTNISYDLVSGFWSPYTLRTTRFPDEIGGTLKVGIKAFPGDAFNPVGGFKWLYSVHVRHVVTDAYGVYVHPHTGIYIPIRETFSVETAGPDGNLSVPEDALIFDPATKDWKKVGSGVNATSAVTLNFDFGKWHHGEDMTMADIFAAIAHAYLVAYEDSDIYDPWAVSPGQEVFIASCKGIKVVNDTALTVYIDYWHIDPTYIAALADVWTATPWELYALMDAAVSANELAFSDSKAEALGVEWLDLARGPSLDILADHLADLKAANYIPDYMKDADLPDCAKITDDMATARWSALEKWYSGPITVSGHEYKDGLGHFFVSNGPFYLESIDTVAKTITVKAFRDYVYKADRWDDLVTPKIPEMSIETPAQVVPGLPATINVTSTFEGEPYSKVDVDVLIVNPEGQTVIEKTATWNANASKFVATLSEEETGALTPGVYTVYVIAIPHEAAVPKVTTKSLTVIPVMVYIESQIDALEASLEHDIAELQSTVSDLETQLAAARAAARNAMYAGVGVGVIGIAIAAVAIALAKKS